MPGLMILGAGGHGRVVAEIAELMKQWDQIVFLDDNRELREVNGHMVIGPLNEYKSFRCQFEYAFVAIGNNKFRSELTNELIREGMKVPTLIHPFTSISRTVQIDSGSVVMAGAVINANTSIGIGCIINSSSSVDHDCQIGNGVHISPGAHIGGTTKIGINSWICIGANIANNINIGESVIVASGAAVTSDFGDSILVGGVPARVINKHK